jgi:tetratricopeptide (TPR) repeat protein
MDSGLLWTAAGTAAGMVAVGLTAWQVRLQFVERRQSRQLLVQAPQVTAPAGGLPVAVPLGRLPAAVRGRDALLAELRRSLVRPPVVKRRPTATRVWVLAGMGGLGKSTVALAAARTARTSGWRVWWVNASDLASLTGGMLEVLTQLGAPESVTRPVREGSPTAPDRAWEFLNGNHPAGRKWLLILDNADRPAVLAGHGSASPADHTGWLRTDPRGVVIVTTRTKDPRIWGQGIVLRELAQLGDDVAAQVLTDLAPDFADPGAEQARELARRLGGLPLALHLAGSYLASPFARWHSFADYHRALESGELPAALADLDDSTAQARATIQRTWDMSLDALAAEGRAQARPLLMLLSCYAPATPVPAALLQAELLAGLLSPGDPVSRSGPEIPGDGPQRRLREGLQGLSTVGLIDITRGGSEDGGRAVTVHPVVADANRSSLLSAARADLAPVSQAAVRLLESAAGQLETARAADWAVWLQIVPHLAALLDWLAPHLDEDTLTSLLRVGDSAVEAMRWSGNSPAAENLAEASVAAAARLGGSHPAGLAARHRLAQAIADQGRDAAAEAMYREVLSDQQRVLGKEHPGSLATRHDLAWIIECRGRYREAEGMYRQLIADQRRALGDQHTETLATGANLARVTGLLGRYHEAELLCTQVLADQEQILGTEHPETLATRHNLAWIIGLQGRHEEAEKVCRQALTGRQRVLGDEHPSTLTTRLRHARMLGELGRHAEAERLCRQVLDDRQRILGDAHPATLTTRNELGRALSSQGRYAEAELIYQETLAARLQIMSDDHPHTLITRRSLGWVVGRQGRYQEAEAMLAGVLRDRRRVLGEDHPDTLSACFQLAEVIAKQGRRQQAEELFRRTFTGRQQVLGDQHPDTAAAHLALAELTGPQGPEPR